MFGSHLSIAGAMSNAVLEAERLRLSTVQVFTKNQQQWKVRPLDPKAVADWDGEIDRLGWAGRTVAHASYLINLASPDDALWAKSIDLMQVEIERCDTLGIRSLVHHPGAFTTSTLDEGLERITQAYAELFERLPRSKTVMCLENTAGGGSTIGRTFDELARLRSMIVKRTKKPRRVAFCIDSCHAHAGGYDLSTRRKASAAVRELDDLCGLKHVRVLHLNDSKGDVGSRLDRHQHIGKGTIGLEGFEVLVRHPSFADIAKILETPKGSTPKGTPFDTLNLRRLQKMMR